MIMSVKGRFVKTKKGYAFVFDQLPEGVDTGSEYVLLGSKESLVFIKSSLFSPDQAGKAEHNQAGAVQESQAVFPGDYLGVAKKLLAINFKDRIMSAVQASFSSEELEILKRMEKEGLVWKASKQGVSDSFVSIRRDLFIAARSGQSQNASTVPPAAPAQQPRLKNPYYDSLMLKGFVAIDNANDYQQFYAVAELEITNSSVMGVRDFDGKYYFVTRKFYEKSSKEAYPLITDNDASMEEIVSRLKIEQDAARAVLCIMREREGDVIEVRRGIFRRV